jgi:Spy/CpxP family protein refolding chaperone
MRRIHVTTLALTLVVGASILSAQPRRGPAADGQPPRASDAAPMRVGGTPADLLVRAREQLVLTEEQVTRLEALAAAQRRALAATPGQHLRLRADLLDAMAGEGNPQAARTALDKISAARNERLVAQLRARQEARAVLTDAQRARVDAVRTDAWRGGVMRAQAMRAQAMRAQAMRSGAGRMGRPGAMRPGAMGPGAMGPGARGQRPADGVMPQPGARGVMPQPGARGVMPMAPGRGAGRRPLEDGVREDR